MNYKLSTVLIQQGPWQIDGPSAIPDVDQLIPARRPCLDFSDTHLDSCCPFQRGNHFPTKLVWTYPPHPSQAEAVRSSIALPSPQHPALGPFILLMLIAVRHITGEGSNKHLLNTVRPKTIRVYSYCLVLSASPGQSPLPVIQDSLRQAPILPNSIIWVAVCSPGLK